MNFSQENRYFDPTNPKKNEILSDNTWNTFYFIWEVKIAGLDVEDEEYLQTKDMRNIT